MSSVFQRAHVPVRNGRVGAPEGSSGGRKPERSGPSQYRDAPGPLRGRGGGSSRLRVGQRRGHRERARCGNAPARRSSAGRHARTRGEVHGHDLWPEADVAPASRSRSEYCSRDRHRAAPEAGRPAALVRGKRTLLRPVEARRSGDVEQEEDEAHPRSRAPRARPGRACREAAPPHPSRPWTRSGRAPRHRRSCRRQGPAEAVRDRFHSAAVSSASSSAI